jgi:hypothetical protein
MKRFSDGYTIIAFNLESMDSPASLDYWVKPKKAHSRLELKFGTPLGENVNVILLGVYPNVLSIDKTRNVTTYQP